MIKTKLIRIGDSVALVIDEPFLEQFGLDEDSEVELSTNGDVLVITPVRDEMRDEQFRRSADKIHGKYAGLFRRLAQ